MKNRIYAAIAIAAIAGAPLVSAFAAGPRASSYNGSPDMMDNAVPGYLSSDIRPPAPTIANTPIPVLPSNASKPGADFLSSAHAFDALESTSRMARGLDALGDQAP
jgi:hypothetical protein